MVMRIGGVNLLNGTAVVNGLGGSLLPRSFWMNLIPVDFAQRIIEAARIAAAIHHELLHEVSSNATAGGAGALASLDLGRRVRDREFSAPRLRELGR